MSPAVNSPPPSLSIETFLLNPPPAKASMQITFKLYASLGDYLPKQARANQIDLDIDETDTVQQILERHQLPERLTHLVLVNGVFIPPEERMGRQLAPGDQLAVWPPIAGG